MLRTDFPFALERWPQRLLAFVLGEAFLGFLAIIAVALTLFPMLFEVDPQTFATIEGVQWAIIGLFGIEYVVALMLAREKRAFVTNPWRLVDLVTVLLPLIGLLPGVSRAVLSSPVLRLARLVRLVTFGVRLGGIAGRRRVSTDATTVRTDPVQVTVVADVPDFSPQPASWENLLRWLKSPGRDWYHVTNPSDAELAQIGEAAGLPAGFLEAHLNATTYPHFASARGHFVMFVWLPEFKRDGGFDRYGVLFLAKPESLLSISRRAKRVIERMSTAAEEAGAERPPFAARTLTVVLEHLVRQNERLVGEFEQELRALEELPVRESPPEFFERAFRLKKELSTSHADLWRLKGMLADLSEGRVKLPGAAGATELFRRLAANVDYLYETVVNTREDVMAVIDLHINVVSFDMNRVMRVLAVVSVLGLIPAVIGGLFGMNLIDNPWPFTLPQVAFGVTLGMVLCLYFFFVKGWLR